MMVLGLLTVFCAVGSSVFGAARLSVPQLPESPFDDAEISTNLVFNAGDELSRKFSLTVELDASPSNTVQLAFGTDADFDGVLSWRETDVLLGWRCGGWFFRDKASGSEGFSAREAGQRKLDWALTLGPDGSPRVLSAKEGACDLGFAASSGMYNPSWNLVRVTARGVPGPVYTAGGGVFAAGFAIRLR